MYTEQYAKFTLQFSYITKSERGKEAQVCETATIVVGGSDFREEQ